MKTNQMDRELEILASNIVWLRKKNRLAKNRMAHILGIGVGSLIQLEKGVIPQRLSVDVIFAIEKYFHIHPAKLLSCQLEKE